jgi:hypothetical protein
MMADNDEATDNEATDNEATDNEIDNSWVEAYKLQEEKYNEFYNEKVSTIKVFFLYINTENTVVHLTKEMVNLNANSTLPREQLITLIKENQISNNIKYKLFSLVRYNINLQPEEINAFVEGSANVQGTTNVEGTTNVHGTTNVYGTANVQGLPYMNKFLIPENYIQDIYFTDTISIFQDLNCLYLIFKEPAGVLKRNRFTAKKKSGLKKQRHTRHKHI